MKKTLTCIICPRGCTLTVEGDKTLQVSGNSCPRGVTYALDECTHPMRTVTSTIHVSNRPHTMVSVKTAAPIPKAAISAVMQRLRALKATAPIAIGDVLLADIYDTDIVATKNIP